MLEFWDENCDHHLGMISRGWGSIYNVSLDSTVRTGIVQRKKNSRTVFPRAAILGGGIVLLGMVTRTVLPNRAPTVQKVTRRS